MNSHKLQIKKHLDNLIELNENIAHEIFLVFLRLGMFFRQFLSYKLLLHLRSTHYFFGL